MKTTIREYPFLSMVAEVGGYVGLMLGVAVFDVGLALEKAVAAGMLRWNT